MPPASPTTSNLVPAVQLDVFTQVPHAFAWMTEQRPLAAVLGRELELRLFNYRDTTPLRAGQVDDEPYGGGAGMVLRVDVVAAALEAAYGGAPAHRVVALTPQGRPLTQAVVEELAGEPHADAALVALRGLRRAHRRRTSRSDAISIGPYVLSGGELPAMVLARRGRAPAAGRARREGSGEDESFSAELEGGLEYPHYTRPGRVPRLAGARRAALRRPRPRRRLAPRAEPARSAACDDQWHDEPRYRIVSEEDMSRRLRSTEPRDEPCEPGRPAPRLPRPWRDRRLDRHDRRRGRDRARDQGVGRQPVPHPVLVDGADAALREAGDSAARRDFSDRVLANRFIYHFTDPERRRHRRLRDAAARAGALRRGRHVRQADHRAPGRARSTVLGNGQSYVYINGKKLDEPLHREHRRGTRARTWQVPKGEYFMMGDNRSPVVRLAGVGDRAAERT